MTKYSKVQLPSTYAWDLLDNQIQLQLSKDVGVNLIQKLVELYALGVEYYESMHSYKYLYFQKKMTILMTHPNLMKISEEGKDQKESPAKNKEENSKVKQKQDEFEKKVLYKAGDVSENKVKDIVRCKEKEAEDYNNKVKQTLGRQADSIKQKLMKRKQASQLKMSQSLIELTTHCSQSSLQALPNTFIEKPKIQMIKVDFTNIINQNQEEDESVYDNDKVEEEVEIKHKTEEKPAPARGRTHTIKAVEILNGLHQHVRPKSLEHRRQQQ